MREHEGAQIPRVRLRLGALSVVFARGPQSAFFWPRFSEEDQQVYAVLKIDGARVSCRACLETSRRSTRVPLKVAIEVIGGDTQLHGDGETIVVNIHGGLIATTIGLTVGMKISIQVLLTNKRANARVVGVDLVDMLHCGVGWSSQETYGACRYRPTIGKRHPQNISASESATSGLTELPSQELHLIHLQGGQCIT